MGFGVWGLGFRVEGLECEDEWHGVGDTALGGGGIFAYVSLGRRLSTLWMLVQSSHMKAADASLTPNQVGGTNKSTPFLCHVVQRLKKMKMFLLPCQNFGDHLECVRHCHGLTKHPNRGATLVSGRDALNPKP